MTAVFLGTGYFETDIPIPVIYPVQPALPAIVVPQESETILPPGIPPSDPSFVMPDGGYLMPLFPRGYFRDGAPVATAVFGQMDLTFDQARTLLLELAGAHKWAYAIGSGLDDLAAIVGLQRYTDIGETDDQLRKRIRAWCLYAPTASTKPGMANLLSAIIGVPVLVRDSAPGKFTVSLMGNAPLAPKAMTIARSVKTAGTQGSGFMYTAARNKIPVVRAGDVRAGTRTAGSNAVIVPLL